MRKKINLRIKVYSLQINRIKITQAENVAAKNVLPINLEDLNLGDINGSGARLVCKSNTTESYKENSKYIPN